MALGGHIDRESLLVSAVAGGISLLSFVIFEMVKVGATAIASREFGQVVATKFYTADFEAEVGLVRARSIARTEAINRAQPVSFWLSTVAGILSAAILIGASVFAATGLKISLP